ncbi:MAG: type II toxin-antitoxin system YafQ family toxin [Bacteroidia bacterium]
MINVLFSTGFKRALKKKIKSNKKSENLFFEKLKFFCDDPFYPALKTHKLTGDLADYWSFSVEQDLRVIFYFENKNTVVLTDIGSHDEVY